MTWSFFSPGDLILSTHSTLVLRGLLQGHGFPGHDLSYRCKLLLLDNSSASLLVQQWTQTLCRNWRRMEGWWLIGWAFISWRWVSLTEHLVLSAFIYFRAVLHNTGPEDKTLHSKKKKKKIKKKSEAINSVDWQQDNQILMPSQLYQEVPGDLGGIGNLYQCSTVTTRMIMH